MRKQSKVKPTTKQANGNKRYAKRDDDKIITKSKYAPGNDIKWYTSNPDAVSTASSIVFNTMYGFDYKSVKGTPTSPNSLDLSDANSAMAGVVVARFMPWIGAKGNDADPINIASMNLYTWVRHVNSGSVNYERSDLIQAVIAIGNLFVMLEEAKRDLRLIHTYSPVNKYVFRSVLQTFGYSATNLDALQANVAQYTAALNVLICKASSLLIPKDIHFISRWKWLVSNIFRDDEMHKASYYAFQSKGYWHYDWANAKLVFTQWPAVMSFAARLSAINTELDSLLGYDDIGTITGDLLKAYKAEGMQQVETIGLGEVLDPTYDTEAIQQFRNSTVLPFFSGSDTYEVKQNSSTTQLLHTEHTNTATNAQWGKYFSSNSLADNSLLDNLTILPRLVVDNDNPTNQEVIEQTRFSATVKADVSYVSGYLYIEDAGTEIISNLLVGIFENNTYVVHNDLCTYMEPGNSIADSIGYISAFLAADNLSAVPTIYVALDDGGDVQVFANKWGKNMQVLSEEFIANLHKACVLSEYTMPMMDALKAK